MRWKTLIGLGLVVGVLAYLTRERAIENAEGVGRVPVQYALVPDLAVECVHRVRIDNLERSIQVGLERAPDGSWHLIDPIAYPGLDGVLDSLFRTLSSAYGEGAGEVDPAEVGLDPPKIVLEIDQIVGGGTETFRLELGGVDLDNDRIYVRAFGHSAVEPGEPFQMRATRALYNTLDRNPDDYRDNRTNRLIAQRVSRIRRSGEVWLPEDPETLDDGEAPGGPRRIDLDFEAQRELKTWRRVDPPTVRLDPNAVGLLARAATELKVRAFEDDSPGAFSDWGLDPPLFEVELEQSDGESAVLQFGFPRTQGPGMGWPEIWYCRRVGFDAVWGLDPDDVRLLVRPAADWFDYFLVRARREDIVRVQFAEGERRLTLELVQDEWWVEGEGTAGPVRFPADTGAVQDVLAAIEATELDFPAGVDLPVDGVERSLIVTTQDGQEWGGDIGGEWRDGETGRVARRFRRFGDQLAGIIEESVADLCAKTIADYRSSKIHRVRAVDVHSVTLERGEQRFAYVHPDEKSWVIERSDFPAPKEFVATTVHLFSLRARRWIEDPAEARPPEDGSAVGVTMISRQNEEIAFRLWRNADGELLCLEDGVVAVVETESQETLWGEDLLARLEPLFGGANPED